MFKPGKKQLTPVRKDKFNGVFSNICFKKFPVLLKSVYCVYFGAH